MDKILTLFTQLNAKQFNTAVRFFASEKRAELVARFYDYCANVAQKVYETGDSKQANKMAAAAEMCGFGPTFRRVVVPNIPFAYDRETHLFIGKIQKGKRSALETLNADGVPNWEADMRDRLDNEGKSKDKKEPDYVKRLSTALANALSHNVEPSVIRTLTNAAIKAATKETEVLSGEAQATVIAAKEQKKAA